VYFVLVIVSLVAAKLPGKICLKNDLLYVEWDLKTLFTD